MVTLPVNSGLDVVVEKSMQITNTSRGEINALSDPASMEIDACDPTPEEADKPTVLLIDDNAEILVLLEDILGDRYSCMTAPDGERGLLLAAEHLPELVVSDVMMPGISGFEVLQTLKQQPLTGHIPVILLTAKGDLGQPPQRLVATGRRILGQTFFM